MKRSVYIETSVISYLTARLPKDPVVSGQMELTRWWWEVARESFDLVTSELVLLEAAEGDSQAAAERLAILTTLPRLTIPEKATELAAILVSSAALPAKAAVDALHVAVAALHGVDYLLTWNCKHLANATLRAKIERVCREHDYEPPVICTPPELTEVQP